MLQKRAYPVFTIVILDIDDTIAIQWFNLFLFDKFLKGQSYENKLKPFLFRIHMKTETS